MLERTRKTARETAPDMRNATFDPRAPLDLGTPLPPLVLDGEILPPIPTRDRAACDCAAEHPPRTTRRSALPRPEPHARATAADAPPSALEHTFDATQPPPRIYAGARDARPADITVRGTTAVATVKAGHHSGAYRVAGHRAVHPDGANSAHGPAAPDANRE